MVENFRALPAGRHSKALDSASKPIRQFAIRNSLADQALKSNQEIIPAMLTPSVN
jgi:hypothetical protein